MIFWVKFIPLLLVFIWIIIIDIILLSILTTGYFIILKYFCKSFCDSKLYCLLLAILTKWIHYLLKKKTWIHYKLESFIRASLRRRIFAWNLESSNVKCLTVMTGIVLRKFKDFFWVYKELPWYCNVISINCHLKI